MHVDGQRPRAEAKSKTHAPPTSIKAHRDKARIVSGVNVRSQYSLTFNEQKAIVESLKHPLHNFAIGSLLMMGMGWIEMIVVGVLVLGAITTVIVLMASGNKRDRDRE